MFSPLIPGGVQVLMRLKLSTDDKTNEQERTMLETTKADELKEATC